MDKVFNNLVYLGKSKTEGAVYLTKHIFDCGWYWAFGYCGNPRTHYHFDRFLGTDCEKLEDVFEAPSVYLTQARWTELRKRFKTAYALRKLADLYHGGNAGITSTEGLLKNHERYNEVNRILAALLNEIWAYASERVLSTQILENDLTLNLDRE